MAYIGEIGMTSLPISLQQLEMEQLLAHVAARNDVNETRVYVHYENVK